jgi:hypothetical protein
MKTCRFVNPGYAIFILLFSMNILADTTQTHPFPANDPNKVKLPVKISQADLRPAFIKWGLTPREQGSRGTCGICALVGALEYVSARKHGKGVRFSVEYLNWASNQAVGQNIDGSFFSDMWNGFSAHGICLEQEMPYRNTYDPNLVPSQDVRNHARQFLTDGLRLHWIKPWDINTGLADKQLLEIKEVLNQKWPVCAGFRWPKKPEWKSNILEMATPENVYDGHGILLVGYRDDPRQPGGGVLLYRNSNNVGPRIGMMTYQYALAYTNDVVWIDYELNDKTNLPPANNTGN